MDIDLTNYVYCNDKKRRDNQIRVGVLVPERDHNKMSYSYLSDRKQKVMYKNLLSSSNTINAGVPQGPVLGPLLFLVYVNDVSDKMLSMSRLFADDNSLQYSSNNIAEMECSINQDLNTLDKWSKQ